MILPMYIGRNLIDRMRSQTYSQSYHRLSKKLSQIGAGQLYNTVPSHSLVPLPSLKGGGIRGKLLPLNNKDLRSAAAAAHRQHRRSLTMATRTALVRALRSRTTCSWLPSSNIVTRTASVAATASCHRWEFSLLSPTFRQQKLNMSNTTQTPSEEEEDPEPIPGVGKWKTSTGIVR